MENHIKMYIKASSNITIQNSFRNPGYSKELTPFHELQDRPEIDWKEFLSRGQLRRMSPMLKSGVTCALDCKSQHATEWDAIVVGTGIGCIQDTEKFLSSINTVSEDGLISPTAFIQSTHNTLSGQISILTKNHSYNMTHSHRIYSFENALLDAKTQIELGKENVLLGSCEESIDLLNELAASEGLDWSGSVTDCACFFVVGNQPETIKVATVALSFGSAASYASGVHKMIERETIDLQKVDLIIDASIDSELSINCLLYTSPSPRD